MYHSRFNSKLIVSLIVIFGCCYVAMKSANDARIMRRRASKLADNPVVKGHTLTDHRQHHIRLVCDENQWASRDLDLVEICPRGYVDDKHNLFYCFVNKIASISFRTLLGRLMTSNTTYVVDQNFKQDTGLRFIGELNRQEQLAVFGRYKKLIVVRHPLDRLHSAYSSKFDLNKGKYSTVFLSKKSINRLSNYLTKQDVVLQKPLNPWRQALTFSQFLGAVGSEYKNGFQNDDWKPISEKCKPCQVQYDFIIRLETIDEDLPYFYDYLRSFEGHFMSEIPMPKEIVKKDRQGQTLEEKLSNITALYEDIDNNTIERILSIYEEDMETFGYGWSLDAEATCGIRETTKAKTSLC